MGKLLLCGDPVVGLDDPPVIADGAVVIEGNRIVAVGPRTEMELLGPFDEVLGGPDHLVLPGFINSHFHTGGGLGPGLFEHIFEKANVHTAAGMGPVDDDVIRLSVLPSLMQCVRGGQTAAIDFNYGHWGMPWFSWDLVIEAYHELGFRVAMGVVSRDQNKYAHEPDDAFLSRLSPELAAEVKASPMGYAWPIDEVMATFRHLADEWHGRDELVHVALAPDWTPACSDDLYRMCRKLADEYDTVISTHVLETRSEMVWNLKTHGVVATRHLADIGLLGPDVSFAHYVWATDEDIAVLADTGAIAVNNPGSNLRLSSGIARVRQMMARGGRVAFGTDSISFSEAEDYFAELRLAAYLQRTPHRFVEGRLDSLALLRAAGDNGAAVVGWPGELGRLAPGFLADAIVVKRDRIFGPTARYAKTPVLDVILDRADRTDVDHVVINGRVVLRAGEFTTVDEQSIVDAMADALARKMDRSPEEERWAELGPIAERELPALFEPWYALPVEPGAVYSASEPPALA
jgi:5-methylthioadenosine/S-adenosylhomocysteine deaminase